MEDRAIVSNIQRGKTSQFKLIVEKYKRLVFNKSLAITRREEAAKEVAQLTFVRAYTHLDDWRGRELGPWLVAIACHQSLNYVEKEKRMRGIEAEKVQIADEEYSEEHEFRLLRMEQAIAKLADDDREIIRLYYYKKVKTEVIAHMLGMTQANILVRLHRIRERLKKQLQDETY